ncbi:MAG: alcohol dehydrogenase catalytic domain-containing protein [Candidatus Binatia bacterium]
MRELVYVGSGQVEWRDAPDPALGEARAALVRPLVAATCDLDRAIVHGMTPFPPPFALGHECLAEVVDVGDGVTSFRSGDRVAVPFQVSCGTCRFCRRLLTANCENVPRESMYGTGKAGGGWGGVIADLVRVPFADHMLVKLPAAISLEAAASAPDNVLDGWRAVGPQLAANPGAAVLVLNGGPAGSIGLYAALIALALGAERVDYYDRDEARLAIARRAGAAAHPVESWPRRLGPYPITVDNSLEPAGLACAIRSTEPGGVCTVTSVYLGGELPVPITEMYVKGITLQTGRAQSRTLLPQVLELIASGRVDPGLVTTERAAWEDAPEAILGYTTKLVLTRAT